MRCFLAISCLFVCSACVQLGSDPQPMRYYLLQPNATAEHRQLPTTLSINLEVIRIPAYLDRPQLTTHNTDHQVIIAALDRWAEPLEDNFTRVLQENLARHLPTAQVGTQLRQNQASKNLSLQLTINSFDGILGKATAVDIRWVLVNANSSELLQQGHFTDQIAIDQNYAKLVQGLNSGLNKFSSYLAQEVAKSL